MTRQYSSGTVFRSETGGRSYSSGTSFVSETQSSFVNVYSEATISWDVTQTITSEVSLSYNLLSSTSVESDATLTWDVLQQTYDEKTLSWNKLTIELLNTGVLVASTANTSGGSNDWGTVDPVEYSPDKAKIKDTQPTIFTNSGPDTETTFLRLSNFNASLPTSGYEIKGIEVFIARSGVLGDFTTGGGKDLIVQLSLNDTLIGNNKADTSTTYDYNGSTFDEVSYGSSSDTWGLGAYLTTETLNDPNFGVSYKANMAGSVYGILVDSIQIKIYYQEATSGNTPVYSEKTLSWNSIGELYSQKTVSWNTRLDILKEYTLSYDIRTPIVSESQLTYNLIQNIESSKTISWTQFSEVYSEKSASYDIIAVTEVYSEKDITYNILQVVNPKVEYPSHQHQ